jgi:hypothetical protein
MVLIVEHVCDAFATHVLHDDPNGSVVGGSMREVPCFGSMIVAPYFAPAGLQVNQDLCAEQCHWHGIKQEVPLQCFVSSQKRVEMKWVHHVESGAALRRESAPLGEGERQWESGNPHCDVIFPHLNCTFGGVGVVHVGGVYWSLTCSAAMNVLTSWDFSLSILWRRVQ